MAARILVIDGNPVLLENLSLALTAAGYCVATAGDGRAALDMLRAQAVDLIIADIAQDGADRQALYDYVAQGPDATGVPLIFLGGYEAPSEERPGRPRALRLTPPIQPEELLEAVRRGLRPAGPEEQKGQVELPLVRPDGPVGRESRQI